MKTSRVTRPIFVWFLLLIPAFSLAQYSWTNTPGNPLLEDGFRLLDPCVLINPDTQQYDLWYTDGYTVKRAASPDGLTWSPTGASQNLTDLFTAHFTSAVEVTKIGGTYYLYCTCEALDRQSVFIGLATSPDGNVWTRHPSSPVLLKGGAGAWDSAAVGWPKIAVNAGTLTMIYLGSSGAGADIGLATSSDGVSWVKHAANPVLRRDRFNDPRVLQLFPSAVFCKDGLFYMMFHKVRDPGISADSLSLATSSDGVAWSLYPGNPVLGPGNAGSWSEGGLGGGSLRYRDGKYRLWYQAHAKVPPGGFVEWKMGGATSEELSPDFFTSLDGPNEGLMMSVAADHHGTLYAGTMNSGLFRSTDSGSGWTKIDTNIFQSLIVADGGVLLGGTDGAGMLRSTDGGTSWLSANAGISDLTLPGLAIDRDGRVYAGGWDGRIYRSTNSGQSWSTVFGSAGSPVYAFAFTKGGLAFAGTFGSGIYRSTNDGATWLQSNAGLTNLRVQSIAPSPAGALYAGTDAGVFRSTDNGSSWAPASPWNAVVHDVLVSEDGSLFAGTSKGVYRSSDGGATWVLDNTGLTHTDVGAAIFDLEGTLVIGTWGGGVFQSTAPLAYAPLAGQYAADAGTVGLWHLNESGSPLVADASGKRNHGISTATGAATGRVAEARRYIGPHGRIEIPHDPTMDWAVTRRLTFDAWVWPTTYDHQALCFKGESVTQPYPAEWVVVLEPDSTIRFKVNGNASNTVYSYLIATRTIALNAWTHVACVWDGVAGTMTIYLNGVEAGSGTAVGAMVSLPNTPLTLGYVEDGPFTGLLEEVRISDVARTPGEFTLQLPPRNLTVAAGSASVTLGWQNGGGLSGLLRYRLLRGADSTAMTVVDSSTSTSYTDLRVNPGQTYYYRVVALDSLGFVSLPSAAARITVPLALPGPVTLVFPANSATLTGPVAAFVWTRPTGPVTGYWFDLATDSMFVFHVVDSTVTDTTKVATGLAHNLRYWWRVRARNSSGWGPFSEKRTFNVIITGTDDLSTLPERYALEQNYPNPFNPSTSIRYALPARSRVVLSVFNTLGQQIARIVDEEMEAGFHEVAFDGSALSSGVYVYRLQAGDFVSVRKFVLLK